MNETNGAGAAMNAIIERLRGLFTAKNIGFAFTDCVSGKPVFYFTNNAGDFWLANSAWSTFRCYLDHEPLFTALTAKEA